MELVERDPVHRDGRRFSEDETVSKDAGKSETRFACNSRVAFYEKNFTTAK